MYNQKNGEIKKRDPVSARIAKLVSLITNPPLLSVVVLFIISFTKSNGMLLIAGWWVEVLIFLVVLPMVYVLIKLFINKTSIRFPTGIIDYLKNHPRDVFIMGVIFGIPCLVILVIFGAPVMMYGTMGALLATAFVIASVYKFYRISYHIAALTIMVVMVAITWGIVFAWLALLIPAAGWAKFRLHQHSSAQIGSSLVVSAIVIPITLVVIGMI